MFKKAILALATIAALGVTSIPSAYAINLGNARGVAKNYKPSARHVAPVAFSVFCLKNLSECQQSKTSDVAYTAKLRGLLASVNRQVNRSIKPLADRREMWSLNPKEGDCDDYVMTKRSFLIKAGVPAGALRVAVVKTPWGEGHAVLLVKTSAGEFSLDNLRKDIVKRNQTGYRFITVASANPMKWTRY